MRTALLILGWVGLAVTAAACGVALEVPAGAGWWCEAGPDALCDRAAGPTETARADAAWCFELAARPPERPADRAVCFAAQADCDAARALDAEGGQAVSGPTCAREP